MLATCGTVEASRLPRTASGRRRQRQERRRPSTGSLGGSNDKLDAAVRAAHESRVSQLQSLPGFRNTEYGDSWAVLIGSCCPEVPRPEKLFGALPIARDCSTSHAIVDGVTEYLWAGRDTLEALRQSFQNEWRHEIKEGFLVSRDRMRSTTMH
ncbi:hypothetical protein VTN77DRAFT_4585 [Rasamsonia byssochlamydoides]|uniref:uncharacterized protein n=1 Tax=Rasamsonia byssochlamydoides TaxID=89139 RepID=UPI00374380F1